MAVNFVDLKLMFRIGELLVSIIIGVGEFLDLRPDGLHRGVVFIRRRLCQQRNRAGFIQRIIIETHAGQNAAVDQFLIEFRIGLRKNIRKHVRGISGRWIFSHARTVQIDQNRHRIHRLFNDHQLVFLKRGVIGRRELNKRILATRPGTENLFGPFKNLFMIDIARDQ